MDGSRNIPFLVIKHPFYTSHCLKIIEKVFFEVLYPLVHRAEVFWLRLKVRERPVVLMNDFSLLKEALELLEILVVPQVEAEG